MKTFRTLALICFAGFAVHAALQPLAVAQSPQTDAAAKAQQSTAGEPTAKPHLSAPAPSTAQAQPDAASQSTTQPWEPTPRNQLTHLPNRDYRTAVIPYQKTQELKVASKILVDPTPLLRPPPPFEVGVSPDEPLQDVLNRIMPEIRRLMRTQTPFVIVLKRDSIERFIVRNTNGAVPLTAEDVKDIRISPGDVIVLDMVGY